jgi:hypothetical protein
MSNTAFRNWRSRVLLFAAVFVIVAASTQLRADTGTCGGASITLPFTDVPASNIFFCAIAQAYFSGLTNGTSATTYSPSQPVPREQMAAFITRTLDQSLRRGSRRAALNQWWTPTLFPTHAKTPIGSTPRQVASDGADLWVANGTGTVTRVRASDGLVRQTWTDATQAAGVLVAHGTVYITGYTNPGRLYTINPATAGSGQPVTLAKQVGPFPYEIAFDGAAVWTANVGSVSKVSIGSNGLITVSTGFVEPRGILYDGSHIWVTDYGDGQVKQLNGDATIAASVLVGTEQDGPSFPVFDGTNIWVPNSHANTVTVVRVKDSAGNPLAEPFVLATLFFNGLNNPVSAAFDGQRILVTNFDGSSVSLWKAADLTPLGSFSTGPDTHPVWACSDGVNFWTTLAVGALLLRF